MTQNPQAVFYAPHRTSVLAPISGTVAMAPLGCISTQPIAG
ncbi:MAG: hypothetical protein Q8L05_00450 [Actinomycetota bacterium]|nr:hypothetical protein [Actinomycetota bacterium]